MILLQLDSLKTRLDANSLELEKSQEVRKELERLICKTILLWCHASYKQIVNSTITCAIYIFLHHYVGTVHSSISVKFPRTSHREHEDWNRQLEKVEQELSHTRHNNQSLTHQLSDAVNKVNRAENEQHIASATLAERTSQLATLQKELDHRRNAQEMLDSNYRKEKVRGWWQWDSGFYLIDWTN